jgi:mannose-6-phosphate isomerase-like protein (cupin superfamily)
MELFEGVDCRKVVVEELPMPEPVSAHNAEHYTWGGTCDAWYLVRTPEITIIEELMPAGAAERAHHHLKARQFFFVLSGTLTLILDGGTHTLGPNHGLEIAPGEIHQAVNRDSGAVRFLVTSHPPSHEDRIDA